MNLQFFILTFITTLTTTVTQSQDTEQIKQTLFDWNRAIENKDITKATGLFDKDAEVILIGSAKNEVHKGIAEIKSFLERYFTNPFRLSWDLGNIHIDQNNETAWAFVDGSVTKKQDSGSAVTTPYRITVVMVKKGNAWKWRLFSGAVPENE